jgi:hypothetical protein|tara:strand:- start:2701 stop:2955 length:255 start_codon:yes stop_codon:yes gene_type:complete
VDTGRPYIENKDIRIFNQTTPEDEFVWHKDREDRLIDPVKETDWMFQFDNELPRKITRLLFIPKGVYHRLIKGTGDLSLKIIRK